MDSSVSEARGVRWIKHIVDTAWWLLGLTFIVSGILKAISVKGFTLTVREFLDLLGLGELNKYAFTIAVTICAFETSIGVIAFFRKMRPALSLIYPAVMVFFILITYVNLTDMYGGIESCGCFGEVIHLGPMETFLKNLILLALSILTAIITHLYRQD